MTNAACETISRPRAAGAGDLRDEFAEIAELAAQLCDTPMAVLLFCTHSDGCEEASIHGPLSPGLLRETCLLAHTLVADAQPWVLTETDPLLGDAASTGFAAAGIRFFASVRLFTRDETVLGVLAVLDTRPRAFSPAQQRSLLTLARQTARARELSLQLDAAARQPLKDALQRRDEIHQAAGFAAELLLNADDHEAALPLALEEVGKATGADHVCIWRQHTAADGHRLIDLEKQWGASLDPELLQRLKNIPWERRDGWRTADLLRSGRPIQNTLDACWPEERLLWERLAAHSFLCLPIFAGRNQFWGLMSLGFENAAVLWSPREIEALLSTTRVLGAIIHNNTIAEAHQRSETRYRSLVTNLKEVVFQTDEAGFWVLLNPAWEEITGYTVEESLDTLFLNYVHPDDRELNNQLFLPLIERTRESCRHEVRYLTKDGRIRWIEMFARGVFDAKDKITGTAGTLYDITERKLAEEDLGKQRAAIEAAIDGVAILDAGGRFTYLNSTQASLFGYERPADLTGQSWKILHPEAEVARLETEAFPALLECGRWRGTALARRRDGTTFTEELSFTQIRDGGLVCVCRDITSRLRAEETIRTALQEKEVMLKEIHHRVKNNMQIVSSLLNLQLGHLQDEVSRRLFIDSQNRIASMALVHEKLYQSRDLGRIDFGEYLRDLTDHIITAIGAAARGIRFQFKAGSIELGIDTAIPCGLIVNELVSNACKHAFPGGAHGTVTLEIERTGPGLLRLVVSDDGCGIPASFDLRQTRSLGMQLVQTLTRQLGGTLNIQRQPGASFILNLHEVLPRERTAS